MSTNHNRIKVADLEKNEQNKILTTNSDGELEFSNLDEIKIDSYNGLDYTQEGKSLDARQGKVLKDLVDNKVDKTFGLSQANKFLGTDENGNLKMFSLPNFQAPWISELIPYNSLPNSTGNIRILGDFFTPSMCDRVNNPNAIIIGGIETINYATFINSQELIINVTIGSNEGTFSCILNNGLTTVKTNAILITLGTVFKPLAADWINNNGSLIVDDNSTARISTFNSFGIATWAKQFDYTKNFHFRFKFELSQLGILSGSYDDFEVNLINSTDSLVRFQIDLRTELTYARLAAKSKDIASSELLKHISYQSTASENVKILIQKNIEFRYISGIMRLYYDGELLRTYPDVVTNNLMLKVNTKMIDIVDIKYIELM